MEEPASEATNASVQIPARVVHDQPLDEKAVDLTFKWKSKSFALSLAASATVRQLKYEIAQLTNVMPIRQKLIVKHRSSALRVSDDTCLADIDIQSGKPFLVVGVQEHHVLVEPDPADLKEDDLSDTQRDVDYLVGEDVEAGAESILDDVRNRSALQKALESVTINFINQPRPNKKLLVLDLDYTLFDMKSRSDDYSSLRRPHTHEFLALCYRNYDLVIWSQTSWRWLEIKLTELGLLTHPDYRISFVLDKTCMPRLYTTDAQTGEEYHHAAKPLLAIWSKLPQFSGANTLHVDDLGRNFALNPRNGVKIKAYKNAPRHSQTDDELLLLGHYLQLVSGLDDVRTLDHRLWKSHLRTAGRLAMGSDL